MFNVVLWISFIVGFFGEIEEYYLYLVEFVKCYEFDYVGVFIFFLEEGIFVYNLFNQLF